MQRTDYLEDTRRISAIVARRIEEVINTRIARLHMETGVEDDLRRSMDLIVSTRLTGLLQKPYIYSLCARIQGGDLDERDYDCAAAIELLNIATYQENTAIDSKFRTLTPLQKGKQYICAAMTREWCKDLLECSVKSSRSHLWDTLSTIYASVNAGQVLDLNLTIDALYLDEEEYLSLYLRRCELLSGLFNSQIAAIAAQVHTTQTNCDLELGLRAFGMGLQITNDFGDNIVFSAQDFPKRSYQSPLSDLRNARITYPLFVFLRERPEHRRFLAIAEVTQDDRLAADFSKLFVKSSAVSSTRLLIRRFYREATMCFRRITRSEPRDKLIALSSVLLWNKYFTEVRLQTRPRS